MRSKTITFIYSVSINQCSKRHRQNLEVFVLFSLHVLIVLCSEQNKIAPSRLRIVESCILVFKLNLDWLTHWAFAKYSQPRPWRFGVLRRCETRARDAELQAPGTRLKYSHLPVNTTSLCAQYHVETTSPPFRVKESSRSS